MKSLYFSRADLLGDEFEGAYSKANIAMRPIVYQGKIPQHALEKMSELYKLRPKNMFINCWHCNPIESAAMWKIFSRSSEAVAIRSSFRKLRSVLPPNCFVGLVNYVDYNSTWIPEGNVYEPFLHKRGSFRHENEVRAIIDGSIIDKRPDGTTFINLAAPQENGKHVEVSLEDLIDEVYVAPSAQQWYRELITQVVKRYELKRPVVSSSLDERPVY